VNPFRQSHPGARTPVLAAIPAPIGEGSVSLRLYDPIDSWGGEWGISAKEFNAALDALPAGTTEIRVLINSPGGEVWDGLAITNALRAHPARIVAVVEGIAASAASFIAAAADELVMMRNSELFIHNAWGFAMGDAEDMTAAAENLSRHDRNIAQIYADKSGESVDYWLAEMAKDRFMTADEALESKLANRIEGVADVDQAKARFDMSVFASINRAPERTVQELPANQPGEPRKEPVDMSYDDLQAGLRTRLGITDAALTDDQLLAGLDEALAEQPEATTPSIPAGTALIDSAVLADLQASAALGREARAEQDTARREGIVNTAITEGRIAPASRDSWLAALETNESGTATLLGTLATNTIPVREIGSADEVSDDDRAYALAWGTDDTKEA
jgi:ATP-dependent Clp endopeptidase proteolytic subunit ClpP